MDDELLRRAREGRWVVTADHFFGRILLDHAVGGRWYDVLARRRSPASAQLDDDQLAAAVAPAEQSKDLPAPLEGPSCPPPLASSRRDPAGRPAGPVTLLGLHLALTAAYAGFQWTVRARVRPQFALVPPDAFPVHERRHQQRLTRVVWPLLG